MSTLQFVSLFLGRAMHLPPVFFKKVPLTDLLDQKFALTKLLGGKRRGKRRGTTNRRSAQHPQKEGRTATQHAVLEGLVTHGVTSKFAIEGSDFSISAGTWIIGELNCGMIARVKGVKNSEGTLEASSVVVITG
jgi:hypothetical protein